jgi:hypothetical protein
VTINASDVGDSFTTYWSYTPSGDPTISAKGTFTVQSFGSGIMDLSAVIKNTTPTTGPTNLYPVSLMSLGISAPGTTDSLLTPGSTLSHFSNPGTFPGGFTGINDCVYAGNNCSGGPTNNGLQAGKSDSFTSQFVLTSNTVTLSAFAVKFQTGVGSFELGVTGFNNPPSSVPEPSSLWLLGTGLLAAMGSMMVRRRTSRQAAS